MGSLRVVPVDAGLLVEGLGIEIDAPIKAYAGIDGTEIVGVGGLAWRLDRCWLWYRAFGDKRYPFVVGRLARQMMRIAAQLGESAVHVIRDDEYPTSLKLLRVLGFVQVDTDPATGKEVWRRHVGS